MSEILDGGSLLFSSLAALAVSFLLGRSIPSLSFYMPLLVLAVFYVPGILIVGGLVGHLGGGIQTAFRRDYSPVLTCVAAAWTVANLPLLAIVWFRPELFLAAVAVAYLYFAFLVFFAVRTVFGAGNGASIAVVALSWLSLAAAWFLWGPLRYLLSWLASPFFLFYAFYYLRGEFGSLGDGLRSRQNYTRNLEAAAINPHDGEAQYQLGLIYQQRRQYAEAIRRFQNSVAIDPTHADAQFQLGRIAREQGRLKDALGYFQAVVNQDEKHAQNEILRELGALYLAAKQYGDARTELERFLERRPYDAEGLYYYGQSLEGLGLAAEAKAAYTRAVEAVDLAPRYVQQRAGKWGRLARAQIGN